MNYYSQYGQDRMLNEFIFKNKKVGFFVDVGAHDGKFLSNSFFFEELGWNGICIEPNPEIFEKLKENRMCQCVNACISSKSGSVQFKKVSGPSSMLSGIVETHGKFNERINKEVKELGGFVDIISVKSLTLDSILSENDIKHIDFCSIDTEGHEMEVLKSIDFNKVTIDVLLVEDNVGLGKLKRYLIPKGYYLISTKYDCVFVRKDGPYQFNFIDKLKLNLSALFKKAV